MWIVGLTIEPLAQPTWLLLGVIASYSRVGWAACFSQPNIIVWIVGLTIKPLAQPTWLFR